MSGEATEMPRQRLTRSDPGGSAELVMNVP